jgi:Type II secretion system (T2SS), protein E, N-terminal domain
VNCENPSCPYRRSFRRLFQSSKEQGVLLQGHWYCSLDCFEAAVTNIFDNLLKAPDEPLKRSHRVPIGLLLLGRGLIDGDQLKLALQSQRSSGGGRLGYWLVRLGMVSGVDVSTALAAQWGCTLFPLESDGRYQQCSRMVPFALLESCKMLPVHYIETSQLLFVAFSEAIDHTALYAIEQLLGGRTEPCVVTEAAMEESLERVRSHSRPSQIVFEASRGAREMAGTVRDYAVKLGAESLALARPRRFLWVRLRAGANDWDLLFRVPGPPSGL